MSRLVGYARVSTEDQELDPQTDELRAAGCSVTHSEHASGASKTRPVLAQLLATIESGDTLVVVRLDRLARSVSHLLSVIEHLESRNAHFKSLRDPIDTTTPQGMFSLQVLGAVAQLERSLIIDRTNAGIKSARTRGRIGGNPGLRTNDPAAIEKIKIAKADARMARLVANSNTWLPIVKQMRPLHSWEDVARVVNTTTPITLSPECLRRSTVALTDNPLLAQRTPRQDANTKLMRLVAGIALAAPTKPLASIAEQLTQMGERTPRGGTKWHPSSVKQLLDRAKTQNLVPLQCGS